MAFVIEIEESKRHETIENRRPYEVEMKWKNNSYYQKLQGWHYKLDTLQNNK